MSLRVAEKKIKGTLTIPEYVRKYIDHRIHLEVTPKICCPFHKEDTPSFSYSEDRGVWSCFGTCKFGGDVIAMHQKNYKFKTRAEAIESLGSILGVNSNEIDFNEPTPKEQVDPIRVEFLSKLNRANKYAKTVEDKVELDYLMSFHKSSSELIEDLDEYIIHRSN